MNVDRENPRILNLKQIQSRDDLGCFIQKYVRDIKRNMINNLEVSGGINRELFQNVLPSYADECAGDIAKQEEGETVDLLTEV